MDDPEKESDDDDLLPTEDTDLQNVSNRTIIQVRLGYVHPVGYERQL